MACWIIGDAQVRRRCAQVRQQVEDVLEVAQDGVVDGQLVVEDLLQVLPDVAQAEVQPLQRLQLRRDARR